MTLHFYVQMQAELLLNCVSDRVLCAMMTFQSCFCKQAGSIL